MENAKDYLKEIDINTYNNKDELIENSEIIKISDKRFIISKENYKNLTKEHIEILKILVKNETLYNPVFIKLNNEEKLIIN